MIYTFSGYTMTDYHRAGPKRVESDGKNSPKLLYLNAYFKGENYSERLALVFGRRWWLNFLIPQFWIPNQMNEKTAKNIFLSVSKDL